MRMADVRPGMRLQSTLPVDERFRKITVTEIMPNGFKYDLDSDVPGWPRYDSICKKEGHIHYGLAGEALFEPTPWDDRGFVDPCDCRYL